MTARNETTGAQYQGKNVDRLLMAEAVAGFDPARGWAGFGQWRNAGRIVRRGQHGTACITVVRVGKDPETGKGGRGAPRGFRVFHYDQTEPLADYVAPAPELVRDPAEDAADRWSEAQR